MLSDHHHTNIEKDLEILNNYTKESNLNRIFEDAFKLLAYQCRERFENSEGLCQTRNRI